MKIGIGLLPDSSTFNHIRQLELKMAFSLGENPGLNQPPHITVKRPFDITTVEQLNEIRQLTADIAANASAFKLAYQRVNNFGESTLFLSVTANERLSALHADLSEKLRATFGESTVVPHEGDAMRFHTSLATGLKGNDMQLAREAVQDSVTAFNARFEKIALFLNLTDTGQWVVIHEALLGGDTA